MILLETHWLSLNRFLLLTLGLWPYERSKLIRLQLMLLYSIMISFIIFQFTVFITTNCTLNLVIEVLAIAGFFTFSMINYTSYCFNMDVVKHLLEQLQHIYDELTDENEIAIIQKYWSIARRNTEILALILLCGIFTCVFNTFLPRILNIALSTNESRSTHSLHIVTEYFIDPEKYFYLILLHKEVASCIAVTSIVATGTMNMLYLQHGCGMFMIASHRIEQAISNVNLSNNTKTKDLTCMGIIYAVDMHRKAMSFVNDVLSTFHIYLFFTIVTAVTSVSLISFRILEGLSSECIEKLVSPVLFLLTLYIYMFVANKIAQTITDHNNHVFATLCNVQWYITPLYIQRLILFLLQRGTKTFNIVIGGLFIASLEGFATLISTSISYFTVIYSTGR